MLLQPESVIYNTATEVVEHLRHPGKELDRLWSLLKPGGNLGIWLAAQWDAKLTFADKNVMLFDKSVKRFPVHFSGFASPVALRSPAPDSGSGWCATPYLYGSFIRDSMPVYPGAFDLYMISPRTFFLLTWRPPAVEVSTTTTNTNKGSLKLRLLP